MNTPTICVHFCELVNRTSTQSVSVWDYYECLETSMYFNLYKNFICIINIGPILLGCKLNFTIYFISPKMIVPFYVPTENPNCSTLSPNSIINHSNFIHF